MKTILRSAFGALPILAVVAGASALLGGLAATPPAEVEIAGFSTNLAERTPAQKWNARLAAQALDGVRIAPGAVLSFNRTVRSWSLDRGYVKAPVSYEGELVSAFGGGVCQTSTTLYNAALLAGLDVLERHRHTHLPRYIAPGRDAAVAQIALDLRIRNPYPYPVRLRTSTRSGRLDVRILGPHRPPHLPAIETRVMSWQDPERLVRTGGVSRNGASHAFLRSPGVGGCRVVTYRVRRNAAGAVLWERLSDDTYPAMDRIVAVGAAQ